MTQPINSGRENRCLRYLEAVEAGDLETVAQLWDQAAGDAELEAALHELNEALLQESSPSADWQADVQRVHELLRLHLPSGFSSQSESAPLTASDVASRLQADAALGALLEETDRTANRQLLVNQSPLPELLNVPQLEKWTAGLGVVASARYWRAFRQAAVLLSMGRCQHTGELAAARQAASKPKEPPP